MRQHKHPTIPRSLGSGSLTRLERFTLILAAAWLVAGMVTTIKGVSA